MMTENFQNQICRRIRLLRDRKTLTESRGSLRHESEKYSLRAALKKNGLY